MPGIVGATRTPSLSGTLGLSPTPHVTVTGFCHLEAEYVPIFEFKYRYRYDGTDMTLSLPVINY